MNGLVVGQITQTNVVTACVPSTRSRLYYTVKLSVPNRVSV